VTRIIIKIIEINKAAKGIATGDHGTKKRKRVVITKQLTKRVLYSAKNTKANKAPLYSVL
jgi:hypothetical protein